MAFSFEQAENEIVTQLQTKLGNVVEVIALPENDADYKRSLTKPKITVAYSESSFDPSTSTAQVSQKEKPSFLCNIRYQKLRGAGGLYETIQKVKEALVGFKPSNGDRLQLNKVEFDDRDEYQNFSYNITFTTQKMNVQVLQDEETSTNLLKTVILNDQFPTNG